MLQWKETFNFQWHVPATGQARGSGFNIQNYKATTTTKSKQTKNKNKANKHMLLL